jgi:SAM-dependent methyltransferase
MHAIALAQKGFQAAGADLSPGMIDRARQNAAAAGLDLRFEVAGICDLAKTFGEGSFDALLCLGNSLPHLLTAQQLRAGLEDFSACLRPGGLLLVQNRNFDAVLAKRERWMEPQGHREGEREWLFLRFYDFEPDGGIRFNIVTLTRDGDGEWQQQAIETHLRPLLQREMGEALLDAGFQEIAYYGGLNGSPYDPFGSGNLVVCARKPG